MAANTLTQNELHESLRDVAALRIGLIPRAHATPESRTAARLTLAELRQITGCRSDVGPDFAAVTAATHVGVVNTGYAKYTEALHAAVSYVDVPDFRSIDVSSVEPPNIAVVAEGARPEVGLIASAGPQAGPATYGTEIRITRRQLMDGQLDLLSRATLAAVAGVARIEAHLVADALQSGTALDGLPLFISGKNTLVGSGATLSAGWAVLRTLTGLPPATIVTPPNLEWETMTELEGIPAESRPAILSLPALTDDVRYLLPDRILHPTIGIGQVGSTPSIVEIPPGLDFTGVILRVWRDVCPLVLCKSGTGVVKLDPMGD